MTFLTSASDILYKTCNHCNLAQNGSALFIEVLTDPDFIFTQRLIPCSSACRCPCAWWTKFNFASLYANVNTGRWPIFAGNLYVVGGRHFPLLEVYQLQPTFTFIQQLPGQPISLSYSSSIVVGGTCCSYAVNPKFAFYEVLVYLEYKNSHVVLVL